MPNSLGSNVTCFIGLFGLNRSIKWTEKSLLGNIVNPIIEAGINTRIAAHFNLPDKISNMRGKENIKSYKYRNFKELLLNGLLIEDQREEVLPPDLRRWMTRLPHDKDDAPSQTRRNLIYQLHSLTRLWALCELLDATQSDVFVFLRPDLEYIDELDVRTVFAEILQNGVDLITPQWQQWFGLNDRFAFCSRRGAEVYVSRLLHVNRFCETRDELHAESLLKAVADEAALKLGYTSLRAMRVRADGATWREGFDLTPRQHLVALARKRLVRLRLG